MKADGCQTDGWSRVSSHGLADELYFFSHGTQRDQMETGILNLIFCRHDPDIPRRNKALDSLDGLAEESIFSHDLEHLLGTGFSTQRPEASAGATGKNNGKKG
jgi:hypothetical protein